MTVALAVLGTLLALGGLWLVHKRYGTAAAIAAGVALLGGLAAFLGLARRRDGPPPPPPSKPDEKVRRTAGDILAERHAAGQATIAAAADPANADRLDDLAALGNARPKPPATP